MPAPCSFAAASILGQQTYVVEGAAHAPSVLAFDRQQRRWRLCQGLATPRVNMAVAALEEQLYVLVRLALFQKAWLNLAHALCAGPLQRSSTR
jgi:hypothetical protein